jgi:hypothetical protein
LSVLSMYYEYLIQNHTGGDPSVLTLLPNFPLVHKKTIYIMNHLWYNKVLQMVNNT